MSRKRRRLSATTRVVVLLLVTSLVTGGVGVAAGWLIRSPAQVAAQAAPPQPSVITASVSEGSVKQEREFGGKVALGNTVALNPEPPAEVTMVMTEQTVPVGGTVEAGQVIVEVSDRPVIYLEGSVPLLRDLKLGDTGEDVVRLQEALAPWGAPYPNGIFGSATAEALRYMYAVIDYKAPEELVARKSELVFAPASTARVIAFGSSVGKTITAEKLTETPLISVTTRPLLVSTEVSEIVSQQLSLGKPVQVSGASIGNNIAGRVSNIGSATKTEDGGNKVTVQFNVDAEIAADQIDSLVNIKVLSEEKSVAGLLVPLPAIYTDADSKTFILRDAGEKPPTAEKGDEAKKPKKHQRVDVTVEETGGGFARITNAEGGIAKGDLVVVGAG